jgi:hypothetical protein
VLVHLALVALWSWRLVWALDRLRAAPCLCLLALPLVVMAVCCLFKADLALQVEAWLSMALLALCVCLVNLSAFHLLMETSMLPLGLRVLCFFQLAIQRMVFLVTFLSTLAPVAPLFVAVTLRFLQVLVSMEV